MTSLGTSSGRGGELGLAGKIKDGCYHLCHLRESSNIRASVPFWQPSLMELGLTALGSRIDVCARAAAQPHVQGGEPETAPEGRNGKWNSHRSPSRLRVPPEWYCQPGLSRAP